MHQFACSCGNSLHFDDMGCERCGDATGFDPRIFSVVSLKAHRAVEALRHCENAQWGACNWVLGEADSHGLCLACRLNTIIPDLNLPENQRAWDLLERSKKHLIYQILRLRLPIDAAGGASPLRFSFASNIATGHLDGLISVNLGEADPVERERQRQIFGEPHRTLVGHMRHESGHYFWMRLIERSERLGAFRALFGDERFDYGQALQRHHAGGAPPDWHLRHVSAYASSHPWEDWAETWAHYLHMAEALDTAHSTGVKIADAPQGPFDAYARADFTALMDRWIPLTAVMNSLNRALGLDDFYPFVLSPLAREKMAFVHDTIRAQWTVLPNFGRTASSRLAPADPAGTA